MPYDFHLLVHHSDGLGEQRGVHTVSTHFSRYPDDEGPEQAPCGIWIGDASDLSSDWGRVDCKRCLKWKDTIMATHEAEESAIVQQMGDMAEFMKRTAGEHMNDSVSIYKLGIYGKAYDVPGTRRAYTYQHQPDNQGAWRLGEAKTIASLTGSGDYIDAGLGLLKQLELKGYGVYELEEAGAPEERTDLIRFDFINADGQPDSKMITHDEMRERYAALAKHGERQESVAFRCKLSIHKDWKYIDHRAPDSFELRECEIQALFTGPQPDQVNRIPAGLYAELEALRTLRDATGVYLQGYMRDEIEDEESCSADQHDAACSVKSALDSARALEWKGGGDA
ncbi:hypothetical protein VLF92_12760 [Pseudomonas chengduensis]